MSYGLPKSVEINGKEFAIRYDYRVILDIFEAMNDPDSSEEDRALDVLQIFYIDFDEIKNYNKTKKEERGVPGHQRRRGATGAERSPPCGLADGLPPHHRPGQSCAGL